MPTISEFYGITVIMRYNENMVHISTWNMPERKRKFPSRRIAVELGAGTSRRTLAKDSWSRLNAEDEMEELIVSKYPEVIDVIAVKPLADFKMQVTFSDGTRRKIDLIPYLNGPIFEPIRNDVEMFRRVFSDHGALAWPNGADIDTDTLYYEGEPPWAEQSRRARARPTGAAHSTGAKRRRTLRRRAKAE